MGGAIEAVASLAWLAAITIIAVVVERRTASMERSLQQLRDDRSNADGVGKHANDVEEAPCACSTTAAHRPANR